MRNTYNFFKNLFGDVWTFWKETWVESKLMFFLEAIGALSSMMAAILLATFVSPNLIAVFIFYIIGSLCLMYVTYSRRSAWMFVMFSYFTVMNTIGLITHF